MHNTENHILNQQGQPALVASFFVIESVIRFIDMLTARIIEKIIVKSRQDLEIIFIGGYTQQISLQ